jgi:hypothetical protein
LEKVLALYSPPAKMWIEGSHSKPVTRLTVPSPVVVPGAYGGKPIDLELATLILQKDFVGFYLMPLYVRPAEIAEREDLLPAAFGRRSDGGTRTACGGRGHAAVSRARLAVAGHARLRKRLLRSDKGLPRPYI